MVVMDKALDEVDFNAEGFQAWVSNTDDTSDALKILRIVLRLRRLTLLDSNQTPVKYNVWKAEGRYYFYKYDNNDMDSQPEENTVNLSNQMQRKTVIELYGETRKSFKTYPCKEEKFGTVLLLGFVNAQGEFNLKLKDTDNGIGRKSAYPKNPVLSCLLEGLQSTSVRKIPNAFEKFDVIELLLRAWQLTDNTHVYLAHPAEREALVNMKVSKKRQ